MAYGDITSCRQCDSYHTHYGYDKCMGGVRMKDCTSYCTHQKKYRKLSKRDSNQRVHLDCPKKLAESVLCVYRRERNLSELMTDNPASFVTFRLVRQRVFPVHTIEDLTEYLPAEIAGKDVLLAPGNVITLFDGLCRKTYQYLGGTRFVDIPSAISSGKEGICIRKSDMAEC